MPAPIALIAHSHVDVSDERVTVQSDTSLIHHLASRTAELTVYHRHPLLVYADAATLYPMIMSVASALRTEAGSKREEVWEERSSPLRLLPYSQPPSRRGSEVRLAEDNLFAEEDQLGEFVAQGWVDDELFQVAEDLREDVVSEILTEEAPRFIIALGRSREFAPATRGAVLYDEMNESTTTELFYSERLSSGEGNFQEGDWRTLETEDEYQELDVTPTILGMPFLSAEEDDEREERPFQKMASRVEAEARISAVLESVFDRAE